MRMQDKMVASLLESGVIDLAQLHGNEDASYLKKLKEKTKKPLIQVVRAVDRMVLKAAEQSTKINYGRFRGRNR